MSLASQVLNKYNQDKLALWMSYGGGNYMTGEAGQLSGESATAFGEAALALAEKFDLDYDAAFAQDKAISLAAQKAAEAAIAARERLAEQQQAESDRVEAELKAIEDAKQAAANLAAGKQILIDAYNQGIISSDIVQKAIDNGIIEKPAGFVHTPSVEIETKGTPIATPNAYPIPKKSSILIPLILVGVGAYIIFKD